MKTRILTIAMVLMVGIILSNPASAGRKISITASSLEKAIDPSMTIESWMVSDLLWTPSEMLEMFTVKEESLVLDNWMVIPAMWDKIEAVTDRELNICPWMINTFVWDMDKVDAESNLHISGWMTDPIFWVNQCNVADVICKKSLKLACTGW
mgnify:CR=1 FL=1|jgi:hypothetical protein